MSKGIYTFISGTQERIIDFRGFSLIIYGVYVITEDGRTLLSENFQSSDDIPDAILFGGMLTALQNFTSEMTKTRTGLRSIDIGGLSYHIRPFGFIYIVLITNVTKILTNLILSTLLKFLTTS